MSSGSALGPGPGSPALAAFAQRSLLAETFGANALAVFALQLRFGVEDPQDIADSVVDGPRDKKCDIVFIHEESETLVVLQAYLANDPTKTNPPLSKASDLNTAATWLLNPADPTALPPVIASASALIGTAIQEGSISAIEFWYAHNLREHPDVDNELLQVASTASAALTALYGTERAATIECRGVQVGLETLERLFAQRTTRLLIDDVFEVPVTEWIEGQGDGWKAVCTSVPGDWLRELYNTYGKDRLFSGNIRDYLGRRRSGRNINYTIERTAESRPGDFWAFNNGITVLVGELMPNREARSLRVRGLTVVNGAQTTGALASARSTAGVFVLTRFVEAGDTDLVDDIIRANNTQNEIRASDFRSNDVHQQRLRQQFASIPSSRYAGARRGIAIDSPPDSAVTFIGSDQAAQALAAFHGHPEYAYHGKSRIWEEDALYAQFFGDHTTAVHIVYVVSLHHAVNSYKRELRTRQALTDADKEILEFLALRGSTFLLMAAFGKCQEIILGQPVPDRYTLSFGQAVSPAVAEEKWAPLVQSLAAFHASLQPAAESGRIRVQEVRDESIRDFSAQVRAVADPLASSFASFAANVVVDRA